MDIVKLRNMLKLKNNENKKADIAHVKSFIIKRVLDNLDKKTISDKIVKISKVNPKNIVIYFNNTVIKTDLTTLEELQNINS